MKRDRADMRTLLTRVCMHLSLSPGKELLGSRINRHHICLTGFLGVILQYC